MVLPIALTAAAAAALLHIWLTIRVSQVRRQHRVSLGDGGIEGLTRRVRAHGNFAENAPLFLILLALLELSGAQPQILWGSVILFFAARLSHVFGLDRGGANILRTAGIIVSLLVLLGLAAWGIVTTYMNSAPGAARTIISAPRA